MDQKLNRVLRSKRRSLKSKWLSNWSGVAEIRSLTSLLMLWMQTDKVMERRLHHNISPAPLCPSSLSQRDLNSNTHHMGGWGWGGGSQGSTDCDACAVLTEYCSVVVCEPSGSSRMKWTTTVSSSVAHISLKILKLQVEEGLLCCSGIQKA